MKKILAIVVIVVVLLIGLPYFIGIQINKHIDNTIAYINSQRQDISVEKISIERHWFYSNLTLKAHINEEMAVQKSQATLPIAGLTAPAAPGKTVDITLNSVIYHGPLMMGENVEGKKRFKFGLGYVHFAVFPNDIENIGNSVDLARLSSLVKDQPLFVVTDLISITGEDKIGFKSAAVHFQDEMGKIDWDGIYGKVWLNSRANKINVDIFNTPLNFEGKSGQNISLSEMDIKMSHHRDTNGLWVGESDLNLPRMDISNKDGDKIELKTGKMAVNTRSQKELFEGNIAVSFEQLAYNNKVYGPMTLKTTLDHLDAKALATIAQYHATADQSYNAIASLVRQNQLITALTQLLSNMPKLSVDEFKIKTPEGEVNLKGSFALQEQTKQANGFLQLDVFIKSINLALDLTLPTPMAEKATILLAGFYPRILLSNEELNNPNLVFTQQQLDERANQRLESWANTKLVTKQGNEYTISLKLAHGEIKLNDIPVNLNQPPLAEGAQAPAQVVSPGTVQNTEPVLEVNPASQAAPAVPVAPVPAPQQPAPAQ